MSASPAKNPPPQGAAWGLDYSGVGVARSASRNPLVAWVDPRPVARKWLVLWAVIITAAYALLWTPNWYPLSDSSLYLSLARSYADGRGLTMMDDRVRLVPPLTPMFLGTLIKWGAGIGALQVVMTALTLVSHALAFLTLRRWVAERLALAATIATAVSYWVVANAFTIMSEPLCVALMWGGFLALSYVTPATRVRWPILLIACALLLASVANRDAIFALLPGPLLAVLVATRRDGRWTRWSLAWAATFALVFGAWFFYRYPPKSVVNVFTGDEKVSVAPPPPFVPPPATTQTTRPATTRSTTQAGVAKLPRGGGGGHEATTVEDDDAGDSDEAKLREGRYRTAWMQLVPRDWRMATHPPMLGGRWICEGLAGASAAVYESNSRVVWGVGYVVGVSCFAVAIWGGAILLRRGHWWMVGVALYFGVIWLQWGGRMKPRYMMPIAPMLFLCLWAGTTAFFALIARREASAAGDRRLANRVMVALTGFLVLANLFPWLMEVYVRRFTGRDFYDVTRRGAYAKLVDIAAWAQTELPANTTLYTNANAHRRIAYFLTGHRLEVDELDLPGWAEWELVRELNRTEKFKEPIVFKRRFNAHQRRRRFLSVIPRDAEYFVVHARVPAKGEGWPTWHLPFQPEGAANDWWRLYKRTPDDDWVEVKVPRADRSFVKSIPRIKHAAPRAYGESSAPID